MRKCRNHWSDVPYQEHHGALRLTCQSVDEEKRLRNTDKKGRGRCRPSFGTGAPTRSPRESKSPPANKKALATTYSPALKGQYHRRNIHQQKGRERREEERSSLSVALSRSPAGPAAAQHPSHDLLRRSRDDRRLCRDDQDEQAPCIEPPRGRGIPHLRPTGTLPRDEHWSMPLIRTPRKMNFD